jgi:hypothetical protein
MVKKFPASYWCKKFILCWLETSSVPILSHMYPIHSLPPCVPKVNFNIILTTMPRAFKFPLSFRPSSQNFVRISHLPMSAKCLAHVILLTLIVLIVFGHHHHHHIAIKELGHLLTLSGLTSRNLFSGLPWFLLPFGVQFFLSIFVICYMADYPDWYKLHPKTQKEPRKTIEETTWYVRLKWVKRTNCSSPYYTVFSALLHPNILLSTLFSDTLNCVFFFNVKD